MHINTDQSGQNNVHCTHTHSYIHTHTITHTHTHTHTHMHTHTATEMAMSASSLTSCLNASAGIVWSKQSEYKQLRKHNKHTHTHGFSSTKSNNCLSPTWRYMCVCVRSQRYFGGVSAEVEDLTTKGPLLLVWVWDGGMEL